VFSREAKPGEAVPPGGAGRILAISSVELGLVALVGCALAGWASAANRGGLAATLVASVLVCAVLHAAGCLLLARMVRGDGSAAAFPLRFVSGFVAVNTALFILAWVSPLSIQTNFFLLSLAVVLGLAVSRPRVEWRSSVELLPSMLCCMACVVAATFWTQDSWNPTVSSGEVTTFKPWVDGFFHAAQVRIFATAHGAGTIEDIGLAGVPAPLYHYAPYALPGLLQALCGISAYAAFAGVLVPMGVLLTGLAAFALVSSWWGAWPGLLATGALLLLPDASQSGMGNTFLGYHWMQLVAPGGMYGTVVLALAWLLILRGCLAGTLRPIFLGWGAAAISVGYKAQFFVASSFLLWVYPPLLLRGLFLRRRLQWLGFALAAFLGLAAASQRLPRVPLLRLDGGSMTRFLAMVLSFSDPGPAQSFFAPLLLPEASGISKLVFGAIYLLLGSLGGFAIAYPVLAVTMRRRIPAALLLLPALVQLSFVVMALGLAMDDQGVGRPEELLHRPFVLVYFLTASWVGGAAGLALLGPAPRISRARMAATSGVAALLLLFPAFLGRGAQSIRTIPLANVEVPTALVHVAEFLRTHTAPADLVQDSRYDRSFLVTALSERRPYVTVHFTAVANGTAEAQRRVKTVEQLMGLSDAAEIYRTASSLGLSWFILAPGDAVGWPMTILSHPAFVSSGYRVYRLD
jgi:hypothetical protein